MQADLLATERDLAAFVFQAQAQNLPIEHGDISPLALLSLKLITARTTEVPGTTPDTGGTCGDETGTSAGWFGEPPAPQTPRRLGP